MTHVWLTGQVRQKFGNIIWCDGTFPRFGIFGIFHFIQVVYYTIYIYALYLYYNIHALCSVLVRSTQQYSYILQTGIITGLHIVSS